MRLYDLMPEYVNKYENIEFSDITNDSRRVKSGDIFVCIKGPIVDGHEYADMAIKSGASLIITEKDLGIKNQIIVEDTFYEFYKMCAARFDNPQNKLKLFGVTGTNGKTTVSYMLKSILESAGHKVGLIGTIQNIIGDRAVETNNTTPGIYDLYKLFSDMVNYGCDCCVMEVSSHALEQNRIMGLQFEVGMFTNLTQDHLDYHGTMQSYFNAKKKLFDISKFAVINRDDETYDTLSKELKIPFKSYSVKNSDANYTAKDVRYYPECSKFFILNNNNIYNLKVPTPGKFNVSNTLCAFSAALQFGIDVETAISGIENMKSVKGRCELVETNNEFTIVIDYAHTPDGLSNILRTFSDYEKNRLVVLFGCGGNRDKTKRPIMGEIASFNADFVIVTSDNPRNEEPSEIINDILVGVKKCKTPYTVIENRKEAIKFAIQNAQKGDIIILAGKGHETYQILGDSKIYFDERKIIQEALNELKD